MWIERRRRRWFAFHDLPADVHEAFGKKRLTASLETEDQQVAKRRAAVLEARWRGEIERARKGTSDHIERDASFWRKLLLDTPPEERDVMRDLIGDEAQERVQRAAGRAGIVDERDPAFAELPEAAEADRFVKIATGQLVKLEEHLGEHLATLQNEAKTVDMKRSSIKKFAEAFPYVQDVQRREVQKWVNRETQDGKAVATVRRSLSELRGYWSYLQSVQVVSDDALPFTKLVIPKPPKGSNGDDRKPFEPAEVVTLLRAAVDRKDGQLADLIRLGMWTGARIESLCALRVDDVKGDCFNIVDDKTPAGRRQVPVHSKLKATIKRLTKDSKDGFVLSGLTANKYGDRSNAIGKRFGRLKASLGFGEPHVFHSIRRTVATLLENAGVPENVAADIIGHDKPTMTYGLYSGGGSLATKRAALERIGYPALDLKNLG